jgi:hypothetical protein
MPAAKMAQDERAFGQRSLLNINNMSYWFVRDGNSANNPVNGNSGVTFPRSTAHVIYQDGLIWGGIVNDGDPQTLRVGGQTYAVGTVPGAIISKGVAENPADPSVRIYRIRKDYRFADLKLDASELFNIGLGDVTNADVAALRGQYDKDWREWPAAKGAPFYDNDGDGVYTPKFDGGGNPVLDGTADEPGVASADMVAWFAINDLDLGAVTSLYGSKPGGPVGEIWQADHVLSHSGGGASTEENYLPAHILCNNYRWHYTAEELQQILKLGVWTRTQIQKLTGGIVKYCGWRSFIHSVT